MYVNSYGMSRNLTRNFLFYLLIVFVFQVKIINFLIQADFRGKNISYLNEIIMDRMGYLKT